VVAVIVVFVAVALLDAHVAQPPLQRQHLEHSCTVVLLMLPSCCASCVTIGIAPFLGRQSVRTSVVSWSRPITTEGNSIYSYTSTRN
jgi:hypothetical protein